MELVDPFTAYRKELPLSADAKAPLRHRQRFMARTPRVLAACIEDYIDAGLVWRQVALEKVFSIRSPGSQGGPKES